MDESTHEERMRHLQRVAYGAVASDAERAAALAELESLRRVHIAETDVPDGSAGVGSEPATLGAASASEAPPHEAATHDASAHRAHDDRARPLKWAIAAGTAALLVGVAVGWQAGTRLPVAQPATPEATTGASVSLSVDSVLAAPVTVADSAAYAVFDRPASPEDMPAVELPDAWRNSADPRLLVTMPDGMMVYAAKPPGESADLCVLVVVPGQPGFGLACTQDGVFEDGELRYELWPNRGRAVVATVHADGSVQVTVPTE